jgi:hypothetical protein
MITNHLMKKYFLLLAVIFFFAGNSQAQKAKDNLLETVKSFPYQRKADAGAALSNMNAWNSSTWKKFMQLFEDDSLRVKATYAMNAYVNAAALDAAKKQPTVEMLKGFLAKAKNEYVKIFLTSQLALLTDQASVDKALNVLPAIPVAQETPKTTQNPVQQLLALEDQLAQAKNPVEKRFLLNKVERIPGFSSFMLASNYLKDEEVKSKAAGVVARLALNDETIRGPIVRQALEAALPLIKGEDSTILVTKLSQHLVKMPYDYGFVNLFNGKDISGWKGLVGDPIKRSKMTAAELEKQQQAANAKAKEDWVVKDGLLIFTGHGDNLCTEKQYGDFEMYVDWKITDKGDAGIYLRGSPQVQIWDISRTDVGAQVGSGGLYNNQKNESKPSSVADNKIGEWNRFHIIMKGEKVTVYLNGVLVVDQVTLENYWDRNIPIFKKEQIELQAHGTYVAYRNIYLREIFSGEPSSLDESEKKQGFINLFDGTNLNQWTGNMTGYLLKDGAVEVNPDEHGGGNLYTKEEFANFQYRFEFQLTPGANNGIGIRAPLEGDAAYVGMEIQVLDNEHPKYKDLQVYQYHGSVYGVIPAKRGFLKPTGEWNQEEIWIKGSKIKVTLNGTVILEGDIAATSKNGTADHKDHPGLKNKTGHIGFLGHGDVVRFRKMRVKKL